MPVPLQQRKHRVYITGFMASGKSTIGPILANALGFDFVDLDVAIAESAGMTIRQIFLQHGEEHFRQIEREHISALSTRDRTVIALGGGSVEDEATLALIRRTGILVYLKVPVDEIVRRLRNKTDRPMVLDADGERLSDQDLRTRILTMLTRREPLYSRADITITSDQVRVGVTVDRLVRMLSPLVETTDPKS
jgi:shikimate kinase